MISTKIKVKEYLCEYVHGKYSDSESNIIKFPDHLDIYHYIYDLTSKRPVSASVDSGNLEFYLPNRPIGKKSDVYNYLSERATKIIEQKIETMFWSELHDTIDDLKHRKGDDYISGICIFLNKYSITSIQEETILKNYYRWRQKIREKKKREYKKNRQ